MVDIGHLLYLIVTRPVIMFATNLLSRFMHSLRHAPIGPTKGVLRYFTRHNEARNKISQKH